MKTPKPRRLNQRKINSVKWGIKKMTEQREKAELLKEYSRGCCE